jgi:hypothetical protein
VGLAESDRRARSNSAQPVKGPGARLSNGLQCQRNDGVGRAAPHRGVHARAAPHRGMKTELSVARGDLSQAQWQVLEEVLPPVKPTGPDSYQRAWDSRIQRMPFCAGPM